MRQRWRVPTVLSSPFFSPDGEQIAFFAGGKLKKISVAGGAPVTLSDAPNSRGGAWGEDGTIVFAPDAGPDSILWRVPASGGKAEPLASLGEGEHSQQWPQVLAGGKAVLYTAPPGPGADNDANLVVQPLPSGSLKVVYRGGYHGRYLPTGHLLYLRDGTLFAVPFDLDQLEVTGPVVSVVDGVTSDARPGGAQFAVSTDGTLVYLPGPSVGGTSPVHWLDLRETRPPVGPPRALVQHPFRARWPPAIAGCLLGEHVRYLDLRMGSRHGNSAHAPIKPMTERPCGRQIAAGSCSTRTATTRCRACTGNGLMEPATPSA